MSKIISFIVFVLIIFFFGCTKDSNPLIPDTQLVFSDTIPFDILNKGTLAFQRISSDGYKEGVCLIDANNKTTKAFSGDFNGPAISPDGSKIAFSRNSFKNFNPWDTFIMNIDGSILQNISDIKGGEYYPSWTFDSQNVIFYLMDSEYYTVLYSVNINNISTKNILYKSRDFNPSTPLSAFNFKNMVFSEVLGVKIFDSEIKNIITVCEPQINNRVYTPCWSPDGKNIAFIIQKPGTEESEYYPVGGEIKIYDMLTTEIKTIYEWSCEKHIDWVGSNELSVCWSPDGEKLAFNKTGNELESHIYLINIDGSGLTQITSEPGVCDRSVTWSR
jgi:Tol biopolymer transport system component